MPKIKKAKKAASKRGRGKKDFQLKKHKPLEIIAAKKEKTIPVATITPNTLTLNQSDFFIAAKQEIQNQPVSNIQPAKSPQKITKLSNPYIVTGIPNTKISPHILDLKKIQSEKEVQRQLLNERGNFIGEEIINAFQNKKQFIVNNLKTTYKKVCPKPKIKSVNYTAPDTQSYIQPTVVTKKKKNKSLELPKIKMPRLALPALALPRFNFKLPRLQLGEIHIGQLLLPYKWPQAILAFIVFCIVFILPFNLYAYYQNMQDKKKNVLEQAAEALAHLTISQKAASAHEFYYTNLELQQSALNFSLAKNELENINVLVKSLIQIMPNFNKQYTTAKNLIDSGERLSKDATIITEALEKIKSSNPKDQLNLTSNLIILKDALNTTVPDLEIVQKNMEEIYLEEIPQEYRTKVEFLQATIPLMVDNIKFFISASDLLLKTLGHDSKMRYLFLFQNNNEIRPTGGFIGSFALVDIDRGNIKKMDIPGGGPYDLRAGLQINLEAPYPLHIMNTRWEFQDGNWFADLPTSAKKLIYLYEKSGGPTVDGVIFINATFLESILNITGPIDMPDYNLTITKDNFFREIQKNVELDYDRKVNKPKQIIADLAPILIDRLLHPNSKEFISIFNVLLSSLAGKEFQIYFTDPNLENFVQKNNWGGQLKQAPCDYLNIVSANIAGEKTDAKIQQTAKLSVDIQDDGSIINTLTVTKIHYGIKGEPFYGVPNVDYLRVYVPRGSELLKAEGFNPVEPEFFMQADPKIYQKDPDLLAIEMTKIIDPESLTEIYSESDKTVFANWMQVAPGETKSIIITYRLPAELNFNEDNMTSPQNIWFLLKDELNSYFNGDKASQTYSLLWQKQAGKRDYNLDIKIRFPKDLNYKNTYPSTLQAENGIFNFQTILDTDKLIAIVFNR